MIKVIGLFPLTGNGGISSWSKRYLANFPTQSIEVIPINQTPGARLGSESLYQRIFSGLKTLRKVLKELKHVIRNECPQILHTTSSGSLGAYRDMKVAQLCKKKGIKTILHCRYGRITEDISAPGPLGYILRKSMALYDQIWVLDQRSYETLKNNPKYTDKVYLTPNPIDIVFAPDLKPKEYKKVGFIGNLIPSKGLFELVEACTKVGVQLDIVGPGSPDVIAQIGMIAGEQLNQTIFLHGRLANDEAVEFMKNIDILALPTYYPWEAFPISILEAMSLSKMVISCKWAAIPDMLTSLDGSKCGIIVEQKSSQSICDAIRWCQSNSSEADEICQKAYEKVCKTYNSNKIYQTYIDLYHELNI